MAKDRRKHITQGAILEAALQLFARQGFDRTTIGAIADQANIGRTTVLFHFDTKANLYAAALTMAGERFLAHMTDERVGSFRVFAQHWITTLAGCSVESQLLRCLGGDHRDKAVRLAARSVYERYIESWSAWLRTREEGRALRPPAQRTAVARLIVATITGLMATRFDQGDETVAAVLDQLASCVDDGGGPGR